MQHKAYTLIHMTMNTILIYWLDTFCIAGFSIGLDGLF